MTIKSVQVKQPFIINELKGRLNTFWVLVLDNQSTMNVFLDTVYLKNMHKVDIYQYRDVSH